MGMIFFQKTLSINYCHEIISSKKNSANNKHVGFNKGSMKQNIINDTNCLIFDQDGTLYPSDSALSKKLSDLTKHWLMRSLNIDQTNIEAAYSFLQKKYRHPYHAFFSYGLSIKEYHENVFNSVDLATYVGIDLKLANMLDKLPQQKFVVTLAPPKFSIELQKRLGILSYFSSTVYAQDFPTEYSKKDCYKGIAEKYGFSKDEICVIGDNYYLDILPAIDLGYKCIHVTNDLFSSPWLTTASVYNLCAFI